MLGELNKEKITDLLKSELLGRIGCHAGGTTYIVPVHYVYEDSFIYAHSAEGLKIDLMRKNPEICFEVDKIIDYFNWESVICWGTFEEITDIHEMEQAMQRIINRVEPFLSKIDDSHPSHGITERASDIGIAKELVIYRLRLTKITGRFEHNEFSTGSQQEI